MVVLLLMACSGGAKATKGDPGGEPVIAKRVVIGFGFSPGEGEPATTKVFLAVTDETGTQVSHPVGAFEGACTAGTPAKEMNALVGATCPTIELHAVVQGNEIIVMGAKHAANRTGPLDPMAREEITRVTFPLGAAVEAGR
jgi:hypothetical protein